MTTMTPSPTRTMLFSVRPAAIAPVDGDAGELLDAVLEALEANAAAIAPACGYDYETREVSCTFQVASFSGNLELAAASARQSFDAALAAAGRAEHTSSLAIVEGDDPELLP